MAESDAKRWLKYGCFGCLGCLGLVAAVIAGLVGLTWMRAKSETIEDRVLTRPVAEAPAPDSAPPPPPAPPAPPAPPERSPTVRTETAMPPTRAARKSGQVVLNLADAEFHVQPGKAGEPIKVEATYNSASYALKESAQTGDDGTWTYVVDFARISPSSWFVNALEGIFSRSKPRVRVHLPPDAALDLQIQVERGGLEAELGGLHLTSAILGARMGGMAVRVSEPMSEPMQRLEIKTEMGGGEFRSIGNASPRELLVNYQMGGMELDLRGEWRADAEITLRGGMGGAEVILPPDVRIEGVPGRPIQAPSDDELKRPTLRFSSTSHMGGVEFR